MKVYGLLTGKKKGYGYFQGDIDNLACLPQRKDDILSAYRHSIDDINERLLALLNERAKTAQLIAQRKAELGLPTFDPQRESQMLEILAQNNQGPFSDNAIKGLFKEIFGATRQLMDASRKENLLVSRRHNQFNTVIDVNGVRLGEGAMAVIAGPCSVESEEQLEGIVAHLAQRGIKIIRGGAFKPRTSPYSFQGLGMPGVRMMRRIADKYGTAMVVEVMEPGLVTEIAQYADILQIGSRNMYNYPLLREIGHCSRPVLLKRHFGATLEELLLSAEYILSEGNPQVILCERGIRTFEPATRSTLDISALPVLRQETHLPLMADVSHAAGRRDLIIPLAQAVQAAGAHALLVEVHSDPANALSDSQQQLSLEEFDKLLAALGR
ncbi:MAG: bifunctional 3-deoxy-7-phosphoheptulonate synthase/chorismate mutase [bacterium]|nr:bifunctional 3-deoxy-7-phosphoheptulonate synthase/chorismate mutase [bacterium]